MIDSPDETTHIFLRYKDNDVGMHLDPDLADYLESEGQVVDRHSNGPVISLKKN